MLDILLLIVIVCLLIGSAITLYENHVTRKENHKLAAELAEYEQLTLRLYVGGFPVMIVSLADIRLLHKVGNHVKGEMYSLFHPDGKPGGDIDLTLEERYEYEWPIRDPRLGQPPENNEHGTEIR